MSTYFHSRRSFLFSNQLLVVILALSIGLLSASASAFDFKRLNPFYKPPAPVRDPHWYSVEFQMPQDDKDLVKLIKRRSLLFTQTEEAHIGANGLIRLAKNDFENLVGILYGRAYYGGTVDIYLDGAPLEELLPTHAFPANNKESRIPIIVQINPGERFDFNAVSIDSAPVPLAGKPYDMQTGEPADTSKIFAAEKTALSELWDQSYPLAQVTHRDVKADHKTHLLDVDIGIEPGEAATFPEVVLQNENGAVHDHFTMFMFDIEPGAPYSPAEIREGAARLRKLGVFESVAIEEGKALNPNGSLPMTLSVTERKPRVIGIGTEYSNFDGVSLKSYWRHRNLFGHAELLSLEGEVSRLGETARFSEIDYDALIKLDRPGVLTPNTWHRSALSANRETSVEENLITREYKLVSKLEHEIDAKRELIGGLEISYNEEDRNGDVQEYLIASLPMRHRWDYRDDPLNAKAGWTANIALEPGIETLEREPFVKFEAEASHYYGIDVDKDWVVASRLDVGSFVLGGDALPVNKKFFAGGGGSVRGFGYQRIGPKDNIDEPLGGLALIEGSLEMRYQVTKSLQAVPFVDFGSISETRAPSFDNLYYGAGLGVRYLTPIGPLRLDVAVPLNADEGEPNYAIYAGIGQAF